ncbi:MAG: DUF721 domain-containing protein, partial [Stellaceae bacterium]
FAVAQLVTEWAAIVGPDWAEKMAPERLSFPPGERRDGTLHLRVAPALALEVQHRAPLLLERINGFFGYGAVARLKLVQGPLPRASRPKRPDPPVLPAAEKAALDRRLAGIEDEELREALRRLGTAVLGGRGTD